MDTYGVVPAFKVVLKQWAFHPVRAPAENRGFLVAAESFACDGQGRCKGPAEKGKLNPIVSPQGYN